MRQASRAQTRSSDARALHDHRRPGVPDAPDPSAARHVGRTRPQARPWVSLCACRPCPAEAPRRRSLAHRPQAPGAAPDVPHAPWRPSWRVVPVPRGSQGHRAGTRRAHTQGRRVSGGPPGPPRACHRGPYRSPPARRRQGDALPPRDLARTDHLQARATRGGDRPARGTSRARSISGADQNPWAASLAGRGLTRACSRQGKPETLGVGEIL